MAKLDSEAAPRQLDTQDSESRRGFLRDSSLLLAGAMPVGFHVAQPTLVAAAPPEPISIGLIGCGRRGSQLVGQLLQANPESRLVAVADAFGDAIQRTLRSLKSSYKAQIQVAPSGRFVGLDAYHRLLDSQCDTVVLAGSPASRPEHALESARAAKQIVCARPIAIDLDGIEKFHQAMQLSSESANRLHVPNELRRKPEVWQAIEQVSQGALGQLISLRAMATSRPLQRIAGNSRLPESEWQLRNWQHFSHLSGGGMLEELSDHLDICNWIAGSSPIDAQAIGGLAEPAADGPEIPSPEHLAAEFRYRRGVRLSAYWRRSKNAWSGPTLTAHGTGGWCDVLAGKIYDTNDTLVWRSSDALAAPTSDALASCPQSALDATLTAILAREASLAGKRLSLADLSA